MKTVVITGSARGFGYAMIELFKKRDFNVVLCDINKDALDNAKEKLNQMDYECKVLAYQTDITKEDEIQTLINGINFIEVENACSYINLSVKIDDETYTENKSISNYTLEIESSEKIVVTISYNTNEDVVSGDFLVDFGDITLAYSVVTYNYR